MVITVCYVCQFRPCKLQANLDHITKRLLDHAWHSVQHTYLPSIKIHDIYTIATLQILNGFPEIALTTQTKLIMLTVQTYGTSYTIDPTIKNFVSM